MNGAEHYAEGERILTQMKSQAGTLSETIRENSTEDAIAIVLAIMASAMTAHACFAAAQVSLTMEAKW